uniref:CNK3/IPCEF1 fusion protein-like isoform X2 n=1 Tax=Myxine glutinosa TaxID=7769 RepID=UPI00358FA026
MDPVTSWSPDQVLSWMRGLDDVLQQYGTTFLENGITGKALLCMSHAKLDDLGLKLLGHQELLLEAIDLLCALHYTTDSENLNQATQKLVTACKALQTSMGLVAAEEPDKTLVARQQLPSELLVSIVRVLSSARSVLAWLSRLQTCKDFVMARRLLAKFCFDLTQIAEQDYTSEKTELQMVCVRILAICERCLLVSRCPAAYECARLERVWIPCLDSSTELGFLLKPSRYRTHIVTGIVKNSPVARCPRVNVGDEIVQVNHQTVVGWQVSKLVEILQANPDGAEVTVKMYPSHLRSSALVIEMDLEDRDMRIVQSRNPRPLFPPPSSLPSLFSSKNVDDGGSFDSQVPTPAQPFQQFMGKIDDGHLPKPLDSPPPMDRAHLASHLLSSDSSASASQKLRRRKLVNREDKEKISINMLPNMMPDPSSPDMLAQSESTDDASVPESVSLASFQPGVFGSSNDGSIAITHDSVRDEVEHSDHGNDSSICAPSEKPSPGRPIPYTWRNVHDRDSLPETSSLLQPINPRLLEARNRALKRLSRPRSMPEGLITYSRWTVSLDSKKGSPDLLPVFDDEDLPAPSPLTCMEDVQVDVDERSHGVTPARTVEDLVPNEGTKRERKVNISDEHNTTSTMRRENGDPVRMRNNAKCKVHQYSHTATQMSRRRISCKDLGLGDCEGWLMKKKQNRSIFTSSWKHNWFVLKKSDLYWYSDRQDMRANGIIKLPEFDIQKASECRRKHAFKACHPNQKPVYFAAENSMEMERWIEQLKQVAVSHTTDDRNSDANISESEDEDDESRMNTKPIIRAPSLPSISQPQENVQEPDHLSHVGPSASKPQGLAGGLSLEMSGRLRRSWQSLFGLSDTTTNMETLRPSADGPRTSLSDTVSPEASLTQPTREAADDVPMVDDFERVYRSLVDARLTPHGAVRQSFMQRRCRDPQVSARLQHLQTLQRTLKAREAELQAINRLLVVDPPAADKFRRWKWQHKELVPDVWVPDLMDDASSDDDLSTFQTDL